MALAYGEFFSAMLYYREEENRYTNIGRSFSCAMENDLQQYKHEPMMGMISESSDLVIRTSSAAEFHINDRVEILGKIYLIRQIAYLTSGINGFGASELALSAFRARCPKVLSLEGGVSVEGY